MADRKRRSIRQAISRKVSAYVELDTDDDFEIDPDAEYRGAPGNTKRMRTLGTRTRKGRPSDDSGSASELPQASSSSIPQKRPRRKRRSTRHAATSANVLSKVSALTGRSRRKRSKRSADRGPAGKEAPTMIVPSDGVIPPWQSLPYAILLQIFSYAAQSESHTWLLRTARGVCRAFAEPALAAFYQSPALPTSSHLETLFALTSPSDNPRAINYRTKVRTLALDIHAFVNRKDENDPFEVASLIEQLPMLEDVLITSVQDKPPYRRHTPPRWKYPNSLFDAIDQAQPHLKSWRWNWLFVRQPKTADSPRLYDYMCKYHQSPSFRALHHLEISDHPEFVTAAEDQPHQEDKIAEAIALLPSLRSLELETCDIVNARFLERLPKTLLRLRLANCEALTSEAIQVFLSQDGGCLLEELVLDHNVRLDLGFLPLLKVTCSRLKVLSMDLHYYSQHHTVNDADARYQTLLSASDIPSWPSTMQSIRLVHLQKWDAEGAQTLFSSLIDAADELPALRELTLHAHISISWRDRASFREQWMEKLRKVFLRKSKQPDPTLASLKAFRTAKQLHEAQNPRERVVSVDIPVREPFGSDQSDWEIISKESAGRRSNRIAESEKQKQEAKRNPPPVIESSSSTESSDEDETDPPRFVQGMCNIVDVMIDNQRPREEQFNESHFLDSEGSGDEDWNENDDDIHDDDDRHAW